MDDYLAPLVGGHSDYCRAFVWRWRITDATTLEQRNNVDLWPCLCGPTETLRPWTLAPARHPAWCAVEGAHPWYECVVGHTVRVMKEK